jgi:hypothetical protein
MLGSVFCSATIRYCLIVCWGIMYGNILLCDQSTQIHWDRKPLRVLEEGSAVPVSKKIWFLSPALASGGSGLFLLSTSKRSVKCLPATCSHKDGEFVRLP